METKWAEKHRGTELAMAIGDTQAKCTQFKALSSKHSWQKMPKSSIDHACKLFRRWCQVTTNNWQRQRFKKCKPLVFTHATDADGHAFAHKHCTENRTSPLKMKINEVTKTCNQDFSSRIRSVK